MWQWVIPRAPKDIKTEEFFTQFIPNQAKRMKELFGSIDFLFLNGSDFRMQFDIGDHVYSLIFKNGHDLKVTQGPIDEPHLALRASEKDWRDAVTGQLHELADDFMSNPFELFTANHYKMLISTAGTVTINLRKKDGTILPITLIFNGEDRPAVAINLDMADALQLIKKSATGLGLLMNGRLKFSGNVVLLMKMQTLFF